MSRRLVLLASLTMLGLSGCVTTNQGYYRQGYYSDGGYYYPAEDGYGDYYQGPEDVDYRYYDSYSYSPFWSLDRYSCGAYYSCSPYWNSYYRRPYSSWGLSFGSHWNYGSWGWYGNGWNPWYDHRDYYRHPRRPDPDNGRPPVLPPGVLAPGESGDGRASPSRFGGQPRPGLRDPGGVDGDDGGISGPGPGQIPGQGGAERPGGDGTDGHVRPMPRPDFREREPAPGFDRGAQPGYGQPEPREMPRFERPEPR
jgi:hypothetical protein